MPEDPYALIRSSAMQAYPAISYSKPCSNRLLSHNFKADTNNMEEDTLKVNAEG